MKPKCAQHGESEQNATWAITLLQIHNTTKPSSALSASVRGKKGGADYRTLREHLQHKRQASTNKKKKKKQLVQVTDKPKNNDTSEKKIVPSLKEESIHKCAPIVCTSLALYIFTQEKELVSWICKINKILIFKKIF